MGDESSSSDSGYNWRRDLVNAHRRITDDDEPGTSTRRRPGPVPRLVYVTRRHDHNYVASSGSGSSGSSAAPVEGANGTAEAQNNANLPVQWATDGPMLPDTIPMGPSTPPSSSSQSPPDFGLAERMLRNLLCVDDETSSDSNSDDDDDYSDDQDDELNRAGTSAAAVVAEALAAGRTPALSPPKKRRRSFTPPCPVGTPKVPAVGGSGGSGGAGDNADDDEEGVICSICFDMWEMVGPHRLVALDCGHLFGDACIRRWLREQMRSADRVCPQCKTRASLKDIRHLYARRLRCVDRSEEHRLRHTLDMTVQRSKIVQSELGSLKMSFNMMSDRLQTLVSENDRLKIALQVGTAELNYTSNVVDPKLIKTYKLYVDRNIEILRDGGCRVICHANRISSLVISQKNTNNLFPSFGLRFIDTATFQKSGFMCVSAKIIRDISLSSTEDAIIVASREARCRTFDTRSRKPSTTLTGTEMAIWSCAFDANRSDHYIYLGGQNGSIYIVDSRKPDLIVLELETKGDLSPVIQITSIGPNTTFKKGGILVCKLQSLWFFEHNETATPTSSRIAADGPYLSMNYDAYHGNLLVSARPNARHENTRYMLGKLEREESGIVYVPNITFAGTNASPVLTRCTQVNVEANTLVTAYMQDTKVVNLYDARQNKCIQEVSVDELIYDACPVYLPHATFVAGITDSRCRLFKLVA